ncbi:MAG: lipid-binding SYLF domain-containing protein [Planctomycetota bacterium]|jgi:lipid-binding SYLF domain-containing protein
MNRTHSFGMALVLSAVVACSTAPSGEAARKSQTREVEATIARFKDKWAAVRVHLEHAHAYAVFPTVGKGGMGIGGAFGRGQAFEGGKMVGYVKLTSASIGLQLGGQSFSEIIFFQNSAAFEQFKSGEFGFDANLSAVAADQGAAQRADYKNGVAVFVMADAGLMGEASIGGQKFDYVPK